MSLKFIGGERAKIRQTGGAIFILFNADAWAKLVLPLATVRGTYVRCYSFWLPVAKKCLKPELMPTHSR
jgi:hypothetical protein